MIMCLDEARHHGPTFEIEDPCVIRNRLTDVGLRADCDDAIGANSHCFSGWLLAIHGHDVSIHNQRDLATRLVGHLEHETGH